MMPASKAFDNALRRVEEFALICASRDEAIRQAIGDVECRDGHPFKTYARAVEANVYARWQDYALAITLVYGALETFVIDLASDYLAWVFGGLPRFEDLPERIRNSYVSLAADHMVRSRSPHYRGRATTADIANSVVKCLAAGADSRMVIVECLLHKEANFRVKMIDEFLGRVGITGASRLVMNEACFREHVRLSYPNPTPTDLQTALQRLDELGDRRNEVAHGTINDSLSLGIVADDVKFLRALGAALDQVAEDKIAQELLKKCGRGLGKVHNVFDHTVVALDMEGVVAEVGDLVAVSSGHGVRSGRIKRIEINNTAVLKTEVATPNAGLELTTRVKGSFQFAVIPSISELRAAAASKTGA